MIPAGTYPIRLQIKQGGFSVSSTHYASISGFSIHTTRHLQQCTGACFEDVNPDEYDNWIGDGLNTEKCNWDGGDCCINNSNGMDCLS
jgi:hypothetical protein